MKYLKYVLPIVFIPLFVSCELLGLEVKTIKGNWQSDKFDNGDFCTVQFDDDKFVFYVMVTDSTYSERIDGLWISKGDTIVLYSQNKGTVEVIVKYLSMNTMAIQEGKKYIIMSRIYDDPNDKFMEVLELKGGFWYLIYQVFMSILILFLVCGILGWLTEAVKWLVKVIRKFLLSQ